MQKKSTWQTISENRIEYFKACKKRSDGVIGELVAVTKRRDKSKPWKLVLYGLALVALSGCATMEQRPASYQWQWHPGYWSLDAR